MRQGEQWTVRSDYFNCMEIDNVYSINKLIEQARQLAADFKQMTGKPLPGVSNEIAEYDACRYLGLELSEDRSQGFDAVRRYSKGIERVQIKARAIFNDNFRGQRLGQLKFDKEWDSVVLVLMNDSYQATEIFEATREGIESNMGGNTSRIKRGAMSVAKFRNIAQLIWTKEDGLVTPLINS